MKHHFLTSYLHTFFVKINSSFVTDYGKDKGKGDDLIDLFNNGFCNNEARNVFCKEEENICLECYCSSYYVITSPDFPERYPNNVDVTWLIFYPGQRIKITFKEFNIYQSKGSECKE